MESTVPTLKNRAARPQGTLAFVLVILTGALAALRFMEGGITLISLSLSVAATGFFLMAAAEHAGLKVSALLIPIIAGVTLAVLAFAEGGLWSDASIWFPLIPLVAVVVDEKRSALPLFFAVALTLIALLICHLTGVLDAASPKSALLHFASLLGASIFGVSIALRVKHDHKVVQRTLQDEAQHDPLTGLLNRRGLEEVSGTLTGGSVGVLFLDLDGLKRINDTLGHDEGDAAITDTADAIRACMRGSDLCARMGGDEFVIVMPEIKSRGQARLAADRLLKSLSAKGKTSPRNVTGSIGVSFSDDVGVPGLPALIERADRAMYDAKKGGGNAASMSVEHSDASRVA